MRAANNRILKQYDIPPAQWAVLESSSSFLCTPVKEFIFELEQEHAENFSEYELWNAIDACMQLGWIYEDDEEIQLTLEGLQLREEIQVAFISHIYVLAD